MSDPHAGCQLSDIREGHPALSNYPFVRNVNSWITGRSISRFQIIPLCGMSNTGHPEGASCACKLFSNAGCRIPDIQEGHPRLANYPFMRDFNSRLSRRGIPRRATESMVPSTGGTRKAEFLAGCLRNELHPIAVYEAVHPRAKCLSG